ncbi:RNA-binding protein [Roseovarius nitratireducens]|uniref:RNA-binding protein n=1 Tax=Roseovarius nitratireducens TaxID=2044597 RepID=UPI000CE1E181|nr:RNA-binding protein [Roseovarius nitratireducens]
MGRGGQPKDRADGPERKCIATGEARPKASLVRFVIGPDGAVVPDVAAKLPGRGIYVVPDSAAIDRAAKKGLFARAARQQVTVPEDLAALVEGLIARRVINLISLARKGGGAVAGYEKVKDRLMRGDVRALLQASDGSERGKSGLSTPEGATYIGWLTADELGQAFSRQTTIHAVLGYGGLAQRVVEEAARLKGLRVSDGGTARRKGK